METLITTAKQKLDVTAFVASLPTRYQPLMDTDFDQIWTPVSPSGIGDQFGFLIEETERSTQAFDLSWKGQFICQVNRLTTAKLISCILMNDVILFTPLNHKA